MKQVVVYDTSCAHCFLVPRCKDLRTTRMFQLGHHMPHRSGSDVTPRLFVRRQFGYERGPKRLLASASHLHLAIPVWLPMLTLLVAI